MQLLLWLQSTKQTLDTAPASTAAVPTPAFLSDHESQPAAARSQLISQQGHTWMHAHAHTHMQAVHAKQQTNNSAGYNLEFLLFCLLHFLISLLSALVRPFQVSEIQISREQTWMYKMLLLKYKKKKCWSIMRLQV